MFPAQKAVSRLAVSPHSIFVLHVEYHWLTAASLVPSSSHILHEQPVYVADWFIPCHHNSHALGSSGSPHTQLTTGQPDQLAEVKSLGAEAWSVKVVTQDLFVPELGDLWRESDDISRRW